MQGGIILWGRGGYSEGGVYKVGDMVRRGGYSEGGYSEEGGGIQ